MTLIEKIRKLLLSAPIDTISGGQFKEVVTVEDGRQINYAFPLATGMAWLAKKSSYSERFGELPTWLGTLHPTLRIRLCDLSLDAGQPLPQSLQKEILTPKLENGQSNDVRLQTPKVQTYALHEEQ